MNKVADDAMVAYGDTLDLRYAIRLRNGSEIISNLDDAEPDTVTIGDGTLAQSLELWLIGLKTGERRVFLLEPLQAFGTHNEALIQTLALADVPPDIALEIDSLVEFSMPNGQTLAGRILEIGPDGVKVDFNHPLADCPIEFEAEVLNLHKKAIA